MGSAGRKIHALAEQAREKGDFLEALKLIDEAMISYQENGDKPGFAEIQSSRFLTFRHLFEKTGDKNYLILAKYSTMASVQLAETSGQKEALALPFFNLAKAQETLGELQEAVASYQKAVDNIINNPPTEHNRPGVLADFKGHLYTCQYKNGDRDALVKAEQALADLEQSSEPEYNKQVWISGAHMKIADILRTDNPQKAKDHLQKAKEIIDANPDLKLRKEQWEKLIQTFN